MWVRRVPPQMDADRAAPESADNTIVSREGSPPPKRVEWQGLLDRTEPEDVKNPKRVVKINEVMLYDLSLMHTIFLKHVYF
jgi:hypothetical protein